MKEKLAVRVRTEEKRLFVVFSFLLLVVDSLVRRAKDAGILAWRAGTTTLFLLGS